MAKDQMQEVFPVVNEYVDGEQPTANKLNAALKQTKSSFDSITQAVGDPWDTQSHGMDLSVQKLGIPSLARMIGPTNHLGSNGSPNEPSSNSLLLFPYRNTWTVGFPLVKKVSDFSTSSGLGTVTPLEWGVDITYVPNLVDDHLFVTEKSSRQDVAQVGDFHIDYNRGEILVYEPTSSASGVTLSLTNWSAIGSGPLWAGNNIVPPWEENGSGADLCDVSLVSTASGTSVYTLVLPLVKFFPRGTPGTKLSVTATRSIPINDNEFDGYLTSFFGKDSQYRLPTSLVESGLSDGDEIPEGYLLLWDDTLGRVVPNVTFQWESDEHTLTLITPENWLSPSTDRYRLICNALSLSEAVGWLMDAYRDNRHSGLAEGASTLGTLSFTNPISHRELADRYNGTIPTAQTDREKLFFRESSLPTNDHPQYLHRFGYTEDDLIGNSANAMRGWLVFTDTDMSLHSSGDSRGSSYGLRFSGGDGHASSIFFEGGEDDSSWISGTPKRRPYQNEFVGGGTASLTPYMGSVVHEPWRGAPFVLKGRDVSNEHAGAMLGFDYGQDGELNYIKLNPPFFSVDPPKNVVADIGQSSDTLSFTPGLNDRLCADQLREFRFRAASYVVAATNTDDSIGGSSQLSDQEFEKIFLSPSIVGTDFINLYSNAIFFSDTGDGATTSFSMHGQEYFNNGIQYTVLDVPSGLYYSPPAKQSNISVSDSFGSTISVVSSPIAEGYAVGDYIYLFNGSNTGVYIVAGLTATTITVEGSLPGTELSSGMVFQYSNPYLSLYMQPTDQVYADSRIPLSVGYNHGFAYNGKKFVTAVGENDTDIGAGVSFFNSNNYNFGIYSVDGTTDGIYIGGDSDVRVQTENTSGASIQINSDVDLDLHADNTIQIYGNGDLSVLVNTISMYRTSSTLIASDFLEFRVGDSSVGTETCLLEMSTPLNKFYIHNLFDSNIGDYTLEIDTDDFYGPPPPIGSEISGQVNGRVVARPISSSLVYKKNITPLQDVDWIYSLRPVSFQYKSNTDGTCEYGLIAEECLDIQPEILRFNSKGDPKLVEYRSVFSAMLKVVQNQKEEITSLKERLDVLENA
jgi:hypothetical protein